MVNSVMVRRPEESWIVGFRENSDGNLEVTKFEVNGVPFDYLFVGKKYNSELREKIEQTVKRIAYDQDFDRFMKNMQRD